MHNKFRERLSGASRMNARKHFTSRVSAPDPAGGSCSAPPDQGLSNVQFFTNCAVIVLICAVLAANCAVTIYYSAMLHECFKDLMYFTTEN